VLCEIQTKEHVPEHWSGWFEDLAIQELPAGGTIFVGRLSDQAALYGVLSRIQSLKLTLVSVRRLESIGG